MTGMKGFVVKNYVQHQMVFGEGEKGDCAYLLSEGKVEISTKVEGRKKVLAVLTPVTVFGEMAIILDGQLRTATAMTLTDCKLIAITRDNFHSFLEESPHVVSATVNVLVSRLRSATQKSLRVPHLSHGLAQIAYLLALHGQTKIHLDEFINVLSSVFVMPKADIVEKLKGLAQSGFIALQAGQDGKKHIMVEDFEGLKALHRSCVNVRTLE
jgi:CRP-like cAMP-binding protein